MRPCSWRNVSTIRVKTTQGDIKITKTVPDDCRSIGCDGIKTEGIMRTCKTYHPDNETPQERRTD